MNSYEFGVKALEVSKARYEGIKVDAKPGTSFIGFRKYAKTLRLSILKKKTELDETVQQLKNTYASAVYDPMVKELSDKYNAEVAELKSSLTTIFNRIANDKRTAVQQFTMIPPTDEMIRLFTALNFREKDEISDSEWMFLINTVGQNYQALRMVQKLARDCDRPFNMPFTPDETLKDIETLSGIVEQCINSIAVPDSEVGNSNVLRFYNMDGENGTVNDPYIGGLVYSLDNSAGSIVPEEYRTIVKRLQTAQKKAYDNDDVKLSAKISVFLEKYADQLQTPEELKEYVYERAEELVKLANSGEKKSSADV